MESKDQEENAPVTPRRSVRLQRQRAITPDITLGPREMRKLNKSRQNFEIDGSSTSKPVFKIAIIPPTPPVRNSGRKKTIESVIPKKREVHEEVKNVEAEDSTKITAVISESKTVEQVAENNHTEPADVQMPENTIKDQKSSVVNPEESENFQPNEEEVTENNQTETADIQVPKNTIKDQKLFVVNPEEPENEEEVAENNHTEPADVQMPENAIKDQKSSVVNPEEPENVQPNEEEVAENNQTETADIKKDENPKRDTTPQLMDESIISVPESPPIMKNSEVVKDATFSPEVDTSIKDTRPHIDFDSTPILPRNVTLRTSTPLSQRVLMRDTPRFSAPISETLKNVLSPKVGENKKLNEESLSETFNGQFKMVNPLEKSILKSSRRKRSLSVTDGESFMQKKVMFMSPEVMNIDTIDEKMLQSFKEEKENSIKHTALAGGNFGVRRKRSMSVETPGTSRVKMPNFRAIHEQQFKKMESISDHANRKAERAKRLITPSKVLSTVPEKSTGKESKIPLRKPLTKVPSSENISNIKTRPSKRSNSVEVPPKPSQNYKFGISKESIGIKRTLPRILNENTKIPKMSSASTSSRVPGTSQVVKTKVEERREKNMSMFKDKSRAAGLDHRERNKNMLKGVRLNRRFELQMQHRNIDDNNK